MSRCAEYHARFKLQAQLNYAQPRTECPCSVSSNHPFEDTDDKLLDGLVVGFFTVIAYSFVAAGVGKVCIVERVRKVRHQQILAQVSPFQYWISSYIVDMVLLLLPCSIIFGMMVWVDITPLVSRAPFWRSRNVSASVFDTHYRFRLSPSTTGRRKIFMADFFSQLDVYDGKDLFRILCALVAGLLRVQVGPHQRGVFLLGTVLFCFSVCPLGYAISMGLESAMTFVIVMLLLGWSFPSIQALFTEVSGLQGTYSLYLRYFFMLLPHAAFCEVGRI